MSIDTTVEKLVGVLAAEQEQGRINSLTDLHGHKFRRSAIHLYWSDIQAELKPIKDAINALPALPPDSEIAWAQAVAAMDNLVFLEIDSTGLTQEDEIVRFTLVNWDGSLVSDRFIQPTARLLSDEASRINGIQAHDLEHAPTIRECWEHMRADLRGKYVLSYHQNWDLQKLKEAAQRHNLLEIFVIGEDLQRHCTSYYQREYNLSLADLCERVGHPLPAPPQQTSLDRARGQYHILQALASGVTDVRPVKAAPTRPEATSGSTDDGLGDLDEHPF